MPATKSGQSARPADGRGPRRLPLAPTRREGSSVSWSASILYDTVMSDSHTASESAAADLARLQQELLRTRIDRARRMTEEQRLAEAFALTDSALVLMHEGVMAEMAAADPALAWQEVRRRLERLRRARGVVPPGTGMPVAR